MSAKKIIFICSSLLFISLLILFPGIAMPAAAESLNMWFSNIIPAVFPFVVCINMLISSDICFGSLFAADTFMRSVFNLPAASVLPITAGLLSGCPLGGKITADMYLKGNITSDEAQRIIGFINNPSPVFVICAVGIGLLNSAAYGRLIYSSCLLSTFMCALIFKFYYTKNVLSHPVRSHKDYSSGDIILSSVSIILKIGGYIVFFGVISRFAEFIPYIGKYLSCIIEMSGGSAEIASWGIDMRTKTSLIAFVLSFGGICIQIQVISFLKGIPVKKYIFFISCIIKAIFAYCFCYTLFPLFNSCIQTSARFGIYGRAGTSDILFIFAVTVPLALIPALIIKLNGGTKKDRH